MRVLVVNTGSSSVQLQLVVTSPDQSSADDGRVAVSGKVENLKGQAALVLDGERRSATSRSHADGAREILEAMRLDTAGIDCVAHRVVHGGDLYSAPVVIDDTVTTNIGKFTELAPMHNAVALACIATLREMIDVPHIAVFDTAFHADMPVTAKTYGIDPALAAAHGIRRYGFHGTAYRYMYARYLQNARRSSAKVVAVHLGGGCSVAAIDGGRSVETSMGMTPLEGLVMGTRAGDIDPGMLAKLGDTVADVLDLLNTKSGLKALSGLTEDTRVLVKEAACGNVRAKLALDIFCHRIIKYVGAYLAVLEGADALLLGGVINENTPFVRAAVCKPFGWAGLTLDARANDATIDRDGRISNDTSSLHAWVIPAREDLQLAHEAAALIERGTTP